ncbi:MAG TPA: ATP-binding protein [Gemmatimonadaceae bacterium]|nr:ATP-binding protein [Gemmatimonadaceae bacterium]
MRRFGPRSVRASLTLWYVLALSVPLVAFALISYIAYERTLWGRTDAFNRDALAVFARELEAERRQFPGVRDAIAATLNEVRFRELDVLVLDSTSTLIAMSAPLRENGGLTQRALSADSLALVTTLRARTAPLPWVTTLSTSNGKYRVSAQARAIGGERVILAAVYPLMEVSSTLQRIRRLFLLAIPLLVAVAAAGGYFLAKRSFAPVTAMASRAAEIGATTLHERLPVAADDELGALARVLNQLLDRLENAFSQQRRFMADASHELRTPVAILQAETDVTLAHEQRSQNEFRRSMAVVQDAARRLTRIVDDIFLLARSDAGNLVGQRVDLYLEDVVHDTARAVQPIADRRGVRIHMGDVVESPFRGDADLLGRVLLNLLDNAIKHSSAGGTVEISMSKDTGWYGIHVSDAGPGIPAEAHARIFDRFFRVDKSRARADASTTSGAGLGLAIARRIVEMHGGRLELVSSRPGHTEFRVSLPVAA